MEALPYIQALYGKVVVIKYGGNAMINEELKHSVMQDITLLKYIGMNPIVVHGGGPEISKALKTYDIQSAFVNGLRVTDAKTVEVAQMVLVGKTNKEVVSLLNGKGGKAVGISGIDGRLIECEKHREFRRQTVDLGFVGKITKINTHVLEVLTRDEYIPVVAPIGTDANGQSYNINADTVAAEIACALQAEKLMLLTDVEGVKTTKDSDEILHVLTVQQVHDLIETGVIVGGMIPKVLGCVEAVDAGWPLPHHRRAHSPLHPAGDLHQQGHRHHDHTGDAALFRV